VDVGVAFQQGSELLAQLLLPAAAAPGLGTRLGLIPCLTGAQERHGEIILHPGIVILAVIGFDDERQERGLQVALAARVVGAGAGFGLGERVGRHAAELVLEQRTVIDGLPVGRSEACARRQLVEFDVDAVTATPSRRYRSFTITTSAGSCMPAATARN